MTTKKTGKYAYNKNLDASISSKKKHGVAEAIIGSALLGVGFRLALDAMYSLGRLNFAEACEKLLFEDKSYYEHSDDEE